MKMNRSGKAAWLIYIGIFAFILSCNILTLKVADDFAYCFSWVDRSRITKVAEIIPSMLAHAHNMNGRLIAHAIAQFFLMFPDWVFDIVNSLVFVMQVAMVARIARGKEKRNNLVVIGIFCAMWSFELTFGQTNLWLDGACNYLWNIAVGLLFIWPYVKEFLYDNVTYKKFSAVPFTLLAFVAGGYGEAGSAAFIFMAMALMALSCLWQRKKCKAILLSGLIGAVLGYISIYLAPAEMTKGNSFDWHQMYLLLRATVGMLLRMWVLPVTFAVLLFLNVRGQTDWNRVLLGSVFFLGAMCANFILIFAKGYPYRVSLNPAVLLIAADAILIRGILDKKNCRLVVASVAALLLVVTPIRMHSGVKDIYQTYQAMKANEEYLHDCAQAGVKDATVPIVYPDTMYSASWGLCYLSKTDPYNYPNDAMNWYFGLDTILGVE